MSEALDPHLDIEAPCKEIDSRVVTFVGGTAQGVFDKNDAVAEIDG
jgi:hypothetical protein